MTQEFSQVLVTFDDRDAALKLAAQVVSERLAACAQVDGPVTSTYWWEGKVETADEWRLALKTRTGLIEALTARVVELHSYDTPEVVAVPIIGGSDAYLGWVRDETADAVTAPAATPATG